jgi:hypothetical protein
VIAMLAPDLLDRRALALLRLADVAGRPVLGPVRIEGDGVRAVAKGDGRFAVIEARGFEAYTASFDPIAPAPATIVRLDLTPAARDVAPRSFDLPLPRAADPDATSSLFEPQPVEMLPSALAARSGSACTIRVSVRRGDDSRVIEGALVRARSADGAFAARAVTDARGEACLLFPFLPLSFPGATIAAEQEARVVVHVDPDVARFHALAEAGAAAAAAALRISGHPDPDALAAAAPAPDFAAGAAAPLSAGRESAVSLDWNPA